MTSDQPFVMERCLAFLEIARRMSWRGRAELQTSCKDGCGLNIFGASRCNPVQCRFIGFFGDRWKHWGSGGSSELPSGVSHAVMIHL